MIRKLLSMLVGLIRPASSHAVRDFREWHSLNPEAKRCRVSPKAYRGLLSELEDKMRIVVPAGVLRKGGFLAGGDAFEVDGVEIHRDRSISVDFMQG